MTQQELIKNRLQRAIKRFNETPADVNSHKNSVESGKAKYIGPYPIPSKTNSTAVSKFRSSLSSK